MGDLATKKNPANMLVNKSILIGAMSPFSVMHVAPLVEKWKQNPSC